MGNGRHVTSTETLELHEKLQLQTPVRARGAPKAEDGPTILQLLDSAIRLQLLCGVVPVELPVVMGEGLEEGFRLQMVGALIVCILQGSVVRCTLAKVRRGILNDAADVESSI